jgi:hypothetical protein
MLREFLLASYGLPFVWGERDCALWACDWIKQSRSVDPGAPYRGSYSTQSGCARLLVEHGGLLNLATIAFRASGLLVTGQDAPGDVGCIQTPVGPALAILVGDARWAWFREQGPNVVGGMTVLRVWKV